MLKIVIKEGERFNEETSQISYAKETVLHLEHSLISLSKWESKWHKSFLDDQKTEEEMLDYVRCMTIMQNVDPSIYNHLSIDNMKEIKAYLDDPMTATTFSDNRVPRSRQKKTTAELIYYWMITLQIPVEFEKWHLNRLLTLIRVCNIENAPKKKMRKGDIYKQNAMLNEQRKKMFNTQG